MAESGKQDPAAMSALPATSLGKGNGRAAQISTQTEASRRGKGLAVERRTTRPGMTAEQVLDEVQWTRRPAKISGADGEVVFKMDDAEVPHEWSQLATDVAVSKYFRKAGVPQAISASGAEESVRQLVRRVARTLRRAGEEQGGYFATPEDAETFEAELTYYLVHQVGAFNSPVWFNCGLKHEYGIDGSGGNFAVDLATGKASLTPDAYTRPQVSACFIQSCNDDLDSIFNLVHDEARVFKYGSGSGTNFSRLRGKMERLSGGGTSSGLMSFLEVLDRAAGATKSGGITRRAAKMVVLDADHPEIRDFITWKAREEKKVQALIAAGFSSDFNGDAYRTVSGQNANNSVRISDAFMQAVDKDGPWETRARTTGEVVEQMSARALWREMAEAAWKCADPGLQFDDTINRWHTCKATDRIYASNPCSEFVFLDDTACNLASLNLVKFLKEEGGSADRRAGAKGETGEFDVPAFQHACRIFFLAQEIAVDLASYPTKRIAERSFSYRPLGLGYANLGTLLMVEGLPYDSAEGRAYAAAITAVMTGEAYALSAEMAAAKGPFQGYAQNRDSMLEVMRMHRDSVKAVDHELAPRDLLAAAHERWDRAVALGEANGYRNAQATVLAPTGTIGLLMDCDTTGVEPDFALIKFKKLAGGGSFKIVNQSVPRALKKLGYSPAHVQAIVDYARGTATLKSTPEFSPKELLARGLTEVEIAKVERSLESVFDLRAAFAAHLLGPSCLARLGLPANANGDAVLKKLGYTAEQIDAASLVICGRQTVEGAPHLRAEHYAVFDCANRCGPLGTRFIEPMGHARMMAAAQPFLSGAISKTINMPSDATVGDVEKIHRESWRLGLKAIAIYRDGSKLSQPLSAGAAPAKVGPLPLPKDAKGLAETLRSVLPELTEAQRMAEAAFAAKAGPAPVALLPTSRRRLPAKRHGITQEAKVGGNKIFLRSGEYEDGTLGEIFIDMHKEGAALRSVMNCFAMLVSIALQYGVPLEVLVEQFVFTRFEPQGPVHGHDRVKFATSVIDYVFRALGVEYLGRDDLAHVSPEEAAATPTTAMGAEPNAQATSPATVAKAAQKPPLQPPPPARRAASPQDELLGRLSGDAPFCDNCGHITVRNGTCYKCLNCGNSMGCS